MERVSPRLHASAPEALGFAANFEIRGFLLEREAGNLLVYRSASLEQERAEVEALGGLSRQYLNHWHEASAACDWVDQTFAAPLFCHEADAARVAESCKVSETFNERHLLDDDFEVIPTPGHTPGATVFLWDSGQHRVLFTGDTIYLSAGEWVAALLESSHRDTYLTSLELIRSLDFDLLVPSVGRSEQPYHATTEQADASRRINAILERLRAGDDH